MSEIVNNTPAEPETLPAAIGSHEVENPLDRLRNPMQHAMTNLDVSTEYGQAVAIKTLGESDQDLLRMSGKVFEVEGFMGHVVPLTLQGTGEIVTRVRIVLVSPAGETLSWTSEITTRYWSNILALIPKGPWNPPIKVKIVQHKGKEQGHWYSLELPLPPKPAPAKKGQPNAKG